MRTFMQVPCSSRALRQASHSFKTGLGANFAPAHTEGTGHGLDACIFRKQFLVLSNPCSGHTKQPGHATHSVNGNETLQQLTLQ